VATHVRDLERALAGEGIPVERVDPRHDAPGGDGRLRLLAALARATLRGDVTHLHTNGHNPRSWLLAALAAAPSTVGRSCLLTVHSGLAPPYIRAHARAVRTVCARYRRVVAVNAEIAAALEGAGVPAARVVVAPAFTASSLAFRLDPPGLAAIRRRHRPLVCATVVAGAHEYGADVLFDGFVQVLRRLDASALIVFGPGTRSPGFAAQVRQRGLDGAVHLLGDLDRPRALAVMAASDLFVRPSRADGDALSVREAVALGKRVVASDVGARPPEARLFTAGDPRSLAETIFHAIGTLATTTGTATVPPPDCLPALRTIYYSEGCLPSPRRPARQSQQR